jgi:ribulose bisphosphate carboxylase small subunit
LYIIEGLRWQPKQLERDGITKTSDLLYGYSKTGVFEHTDSDVMSEFNALRSHISGCFVFQAGFDVKKRHQIAVIHKR